MPDLWSHGEGSSLLEHLREVMSAAESFSERIALACHDVGKATHPWQNYIRSQYEKSPHPHAAGGGVLAALLLSKLGDIEGALVALHAASAHHSFLMRVQSSSLAEFLDIYSDDQAKAFWLDSTMGIASLLPEIPLKMLEEAWEDLGRLGSLAPERCSFSKKLMRGIHPERRLSIALRSRFLLGRLCLMDWQSAKKQAGNAAMIKDWREIYPSKPFLTRPERTYQDRGRKIDRLRGELKARFHATLETDSLFYFIDAPTGLGKTEAMLSGAERLLHACGKERIIFGVPQVSIADQIFDDYFHEGDCAQIWNYRRQEKTTAETNQEPECESDAGLRLEMAEAQHPFSESYNVTTFNQILLAMLHPHRNRCVGGLGLHNAVIIMDEFHKLPMLILPYFFRLAREYAEQFKCCFVLGSATPLAPMPYLGLENSIRISPVETEPLYHSDVIDERRLYRSIGLQTIEQIYQRIETFHDVSEQNLLVVLNLVGDGCWPLRRAFGVGYSPWKELEALQSEDNQGRIIVFLDGLVIPGLRRDLIRACKTAMKHRPVTLITTQMVEVGVDLDFDAALIDYQGLAATIQRGGRVGREGRPSPCEIELFSLSLAEGSSFDKLIEMQAKDDPRMKSVIFEDMASKIKDFYRAEKRFFSQWELGVPYKDSNLADELLKIQEKVWSGSLDPDWIESLLSMDGGSGNLGIEISHLKMIAELSISNQQPEIVIFRNMEEADKLFVMEQKILRGESSPGERKLFFKILGDHQVTLSRRILPEEMGLNQVGALKIPDPICVYTVESEII